MQITPQRIRVLCKMAFEGARDEGGREFASAMTEAYEELWQALTKDAQAQVQAQAEAKLASKLEAAKEEGRAKASDEKRPAPETQERALAPEPLA